MVARTHMYTCAATVWDLSIVQGPFCVAPCQTQSLVTIRNFFIAVSQSRRLTHTDPTIARGSGHWPQVFKAMFPNTPVLPQLVRTCGACGYSEKNSSQGERAAHSLARRLRTKQHQTVTGL